tara:strand:+ start:2737 stop:3075 length:339 start_codon:yes stop_codon:yes gene_type:complete
MSLPPDLLIIQFLNGIDPGPLFVASLFPYLLFLYWAKKSEYIPSISMWGFRLTLLFVFMTIIFAILAKVLFGEELTNIDPLHGAAESFLTLSDALVLFGFIQLIQRNEVKNS